MNVGSKKHAALPGNLRRAVRRGMSSGSFVTHVNSPPCTPPHPARSSRGTELS